MTPWKSQLNSLLPTYCHLCSGTTTSSPLCTLCCESLPLNNGPRCQKCDLPTPATTPECADCLQNRPHFSLNISAYRFEFPLDIIIRRLKENRDHVWADALSKALVDRIRDSYKHNYPQLLCPIPLHWRRQMVRGYNQSSIICQFLSTRLKIPHGKLLRKVRPSKSQQGLDRNQRAHNLSNSFSCTTTQPLEHVALVDDVMTTGATANAAAMQLKRAGIERVDIWTLARTPKPS